jgi:hypothetical protein
VHNDKKVGNLENFGMVKSNSGLSIFLMVFSMFAFTIIYVIVSFSIYLPMFNNLEKANYASDLVVTNYWDYLNIYSQLMKDLVTGTIE